MTMHAKVSGAWKEVTAPSVRVSGAWKTVQEGWVRVSGTWKQFFMWFSAGNDKTSVSGTGPAPGTPVSDAVTCTPVGGASPFSYLWEHVSGDVVTVNSSTSAATTFQFTNGTSSTVTKSGVYRCRVTDNLSNIVYSPNVTVSLESTP